MKEWDIRKELEKIQEHNPFTHLGDAVYTLLYRAIIRMDVSADEVLSDTDLARKLNISRTPIRNALQKLQEDGLIIRSAGQGYLPAPLLREECAQLMEARLAVEGQAALRAADRISEKQLAAREQYDDSLCSPAAAIHHTRCAGQYLAHRLHPDLLHRGQPGL
ncbi:MAG: GntR family transcriptional regulator [Solobacterium sp.]|nr:GntR family transcriptional regulator [Solobacterium sp.]MBR3127433.1 GntR family transcriptional regulator [Solobacterium sp.]